MQFVPNTFSTYRCDYFERKHLQQSILLRSGSTSTITIPPLPETLMIPLQLSTASVAYHHQEQMSIWNNGQSLPTLTLWTMIIFKNRNNIDDNDDWVKKKR